MCASEQAPNAPDDGCRTCWLWEGSLGGLCRMPRYGSKTSLPSTPHCRAPADPNIDIAAIHLYPAQWCGSGASDVRLAAFTRDWLRAHAEVCARYVRGCAWRAHAPLRWLWHLPGRTSLCPAAGPGLHVSSGVASRGIVRRNHAACRMWHARTRMWSSSSALLCGGAVRLWHCACRQLRKPLLLSEFGLQRQPPSAHASRPAWMAQVRAVAA